MQELYDYRRLTFDTTPSANTHAAIEARLQSIRDATLIGVFEGVIGLPTNELVMLSAWSGREHVEQADRAMNGLPDLVGQHGTTVRATVRPAGMARLSTPGVYAHRWFEIASRDWEPFLTLSQSSWPAFEAAFDARIHGFWRCETDAATTRVLLLTSYPSLAAWERSRTDYQTEDEKSAQANFRARRELTRWSNVIITRLLGRT